MDERPPNRVAKWRLSKHARNDKHKWRKLTEKEMQAYYDGLKKLYGKDEK